MTREEIAEILKYASSTELYIVSWDNKLLKIICPFSVIVKNDIGFFSKGMSVLVEQVKVTKEFKTVYLINGQAYYYYHFEIVLNTE